MAIKNRIMAVSPIDNGVVVLGYLLPSGSEENEVLLSGSILVGILCPRHFR